MTPSELLKIKERADRATEGPWYHRQAGQHQPSDPTNRYDWIGDSEHQGQHKKIIVARNSLHGGTVDYAFIAHARTDIPALLAHIAELERVIAEGKEDREEGATLIRKMSVGGWMWDQIKAAKAALAWADKKPRTP